MLILLRRGWLEQVGQKARQMCGIRDRRIWKQIWFCILAFYVWIEAIFDLQQI